MRLPHRPIPELTAEEISRFWSQVDRTGGPDACWLYGLSSNSHPLMYYRGFSWHGVTYPAHRVAYTITKGPIPDELELDHTCDVKACVNPAHLESVTHQENMRRRYERQRTWEIYVNWIWDCGSRWSLRGLPRQHLRQLIKEGNIRTRYWWTQGFINREDVMRATDEYARREREEDARRRALADLVS